MGGLSAFDHSQVSRPAPASIIVRFDPKATFYGTGPHERQVRKITSSAVDNIPI
jgi:hypothetical protein